MNFLPPDIDAYSARFTEQESELLSRLDRETRAKVLLPRMLSGHMQGRILSMFSRMIKPCRILEIGTYTGYSALCLAEGLDEDGVLHTIDVNEELTSIVNRYFSSAAHGSKIRFHVGEAVKIIPALREEFDLVFIDADKENYSNYFDLVFPLLREGGWIIADNVLWSGKVTESAELQDADTIALKAYSEKIAADARVRQVLLPVRDGLMICQKRSV